MVNLAFYSDQIIPESKEIDLRLLAMMESQGMGTRIGYIPSGPEPERHFFNERKRYYGAYGLEMSLFYDLDETHSAEEKEALFACDAIHLTGGHTGGYLHRLRTSGMLPLLRNWALQGGVLIGTSAGAILMTPTIATDALFTGSVPEALTEETALDLVPFEFFPHLSEKATYLPELVRYSKLTSRPIVACDVGDGIIVSGEWVSCIGKPILIADGVVKPANDITLGRLSLPEKS